VPAQRQALLDCAQVQTQASFLAYIDVFWTLAIIALLMIPTAAVLRRIDLSAPARGH
jgi:DHA2 family multidrug resistance protein